MHRPFFKYSGVDLANVFDKSKDDLKTIETLLEELAHRKKPKMVKLRAEVQIHVRKLKGNSGQERTEKEHKEEKQHIDSSSTISKIKSSSSPSTTIQYTKKTKEKTSSKNTSRYLDSSPKQSNAPHYMDEIPSDIAIIRDSGNLTDVPAKFQFELRSDMLLNLKEEDNLEKRYEACVKFLIAEIRKKGAGTKQLILENGQKINIDGHNTGYQFFFDGETDLFEGAKVQSVINGSQSEGQINAVFGKKIILSLTDDFGDHIPHCVLKVDNTAMLEALQSRLENIVKQEASGFNTKLARAVIENDGDEKLPAVLSENSIKGLNDKQKEAVCKIATNDVFYLWGPPGTGKTQTLSVVTETLFDSDKKIFLCSNTNQAVDQVLLKICKKFKKQHPALIDGKIVRIGKISHPELEKDWYEFVNLDGIVGRKSESLNAQKRKLELLLDQINKRAETAIKVSKKFIGLDVLHEQLQSLDKQIIQEDKSLKNLENNQLDAKKKVQTLFTEKEKIQSSSFTRMFRRSVEEVDAEIRRTQTKIDEIKINCDKGRSLQQEKSQQRELFKKEISQLEKELQGQNRAENRRQIEQLEKEKLPISKEIGDINKQLDDIANTVLTNAKVVGATITKAFLSPKQFSGFDTVIIDEASMVMLPALFHAAGLAKEKVVISGDFRQLSPIVQTEQKELIDSIGGDVFQASGLVKAFREARPLKCTVMLNEQYRMDEKICNLISARMYNGALLTSKNRNVVSSHPPEPFSASLTIVDTSTIYPFSNRDSFNSRYNLMHALAIRNLSKHLRINDFSKHSSVGVCTPYAAQAKLLGKILKAANLGEIEAGTVHKYQGDEKDVMIFDVPDSLGENYAGFFLQADTPEDNGARLINVALSRAKNHLVIFANLAFLDKKLPNHAILRSLLAEMQNKGNVIDVREVLKLWPIVEDLKKYGSSLALDLDAEKTGLFNQKEFELVSNQDIANAKRSIVVFSGFITQQRIAALDTLFRNKIGEGVKIRCITRPPSKNGSIPLEVGKSALNSLEAIGCIVDTRGNIHEKALIVDGQIVWFGSLNPLSHTSKTAEVMARIESTDVAKQLFSFLTVSKKSSEKEHNDSFTNKENPNCPECDSRAAFMTGRYGGYWKCEECSWTNSVDKYTGNKNKTTSSHPKKEGPKCPKCGAATYSRKGRYGVFYGCSKYPACRGIINIKKKT